MILKRDVVKMSASAGPETNHPTPLTYFKAAMILVIITAIEVGIVYISALESIMIPLLIILSVVKFAIVVLFYMHLKFDHSLFSWMFFGGLTVALFAFILVLTLFQVFSSPSNPDVVTAEAKHGEDAHEEEISKDPSAEEETSVETVSTDKQSTGNLLVAKGCGACHAVTDLSGATGVLGPNLDGIGSRASSRQQGLSAEEYIRESIESPAAFVVEGFDPIMPELRSTLTDSEFEQLVSYLMSLN